MKYMVNKTIYEITQVSHTEKHLVFLVHDLIEQDMVKILVPTWEYRDCFGFYVEGIEPEMVILNHLSDYEQFHSDWELLNKLEELGETLLGYS